MTGKSFAGKLAASLLVAITAGLVVCMLIALLGSYLISIEKIEEKAGDWIAVLSLLLGGSVSSFVAAKCSSDLRIVMSLAGAGAFLLILLCTGALFFDGIKGGVGATALTLFGVALVVWLLGKKGRNKHKYKVPKLRF